MNVTQYMGEDTVSSLVDENHMERSIVGLGRTSNRKAWRIQDAKLEDGRRVWELFVEEFMLYAKWCGVIDNAGIVMGPAYKDTEDERVIHTEHLVRGREITGDKLYWLMPGFHTQDGCVLETLRHVYRGPGSVVFCSSSGLTFASKKDDYAIASGKATTAFRDLINQCLKQCGSDYD